MGNDIDTLVSALLGYAGAILVVLGSFSRQARDFADSKSNLRLIDGDEVVRLVLDHYESLDSKYKGRIPLKRVYILEGIGESEG